MYMKMVFNTFKHVVSLFRIWYFKGQTGNPKVLIILVCRHDMR